MAFSFAYLKNFTVMLNREAFDIGELQHNGSLIDLLAVAVAIDADMIGTCFHRVGAPSAFIGAKELDEEKFSPLSSSHCSQK